MSCQFSDGTNFIYGIFYDMTADTNKTVLILGNKFLEGTANCTLTNEMTLDFEDILPKGPYLPCVSMAGRALLAGCPRYVCSLKAIHHLINLTYRQTSSISCTKRSKNVNISLSAVMICGRHWISRDFIPVIYVHVIHPLRLCMFIKLDSINM